MIRHKRGFQVLIRRVRERNDRGVNRSLKTLGRRFREIDNREVNRGLKNLGRVRKRDDTGMKVRYSFRQEG